MHAPFVASMTVNLIGAAGILRVIQQRGGVEYLRGRLFGVRTESDPAIVNRASLFTVLPLKERSIVFLGDSLTAHGEWHELFDNPRMVNRGIGGDTTVGVLGRVDEIARTNPKAVFLMIGTNDPFTLGLSPAESLGHYRRIVERISSISPDTVLYCQSILPTSAPKKNAWVKQVNDGIRTMEGIRYIDMYDRFLQGDLLNPALSADGIHLNGNGYQLWKECLLEQCSGVFQKAMAAAV